MALRLQADDPDFPRRFRAFLATKREASEDVEQTVRAIIAEVARDGDKALVALTRRFDRNELDAAGLRVTEAEIDRAVAACDAKTLDALKLAHERIDAYHRRQLPQGRPLHGCARGRTRPPLDRRLPRSGSTFPAARRPIRHRC